jgi:hypothetical protein
MGRVNRRWALPAQSALVSDVLFFRRVLRVLKWALLVEERKGLTATGYSPSNEGWITEFDTGINYCFIFYEKISI